MGPFLPALAAAFIAVVAFVSIDRSEPGILTGFKLVFGGISAAMALGAVKFAIDWNRPQAAARAETRPSSNTPDAHSTAGIVSIGDNASTSASISSATFDHGAAESHGSGDVGGSSYDCGDTGDSGGGCDSGGGSWS